MSSVVKPVAKVFGGGGGGSGVMASALAAAAPAPAAPVAPVAPAASDAAAVRQDKQRFAGSADQVASLGGGDTLGKPKKRAASRELLG